MAFAEFELNNAYTTTQTLFGEAKQWVPVPAAFPPIQYISTSSIAYPADGDFMGCRIYNDTTSAGYTVAQIGGYLKGGKWLYFAGTGHITFSATGTTKVQLYYRSPNEGVEI